MLRSQKSDRHPVCTELMLAVILLITILKKKVLLDGSIAYLALFHSLLPHLNGITSFYMTGTSLTI